MAVASATLLMANYYQEMRQKRDVLDESQNFTDSLQSTTSGTWLNSSITSVEGSEVYAALPYQLTVTDEVMLALHGIIFILAVVGNGLVITTLAQHRRMRTVTNIFLLNLAVSDLLLAIVCMPFTIMPFVMRNFMFGSVMCSLIRYLQGMTVSASAFTLVAISLERFCAICSPLKSRTWQHLRHSYKMIAGIWMTAILLNIPMALFQKIERSPNGSKQCLDEWPNDDWKVAYYLFHLLLADLLVPLMIMSIAYGMIAKTLWNGVRTFSVAGSAHKAAAEKAKRQMSLTSEVSDISDESEIPLGINHGSANGHITSPESNGDVRNKFNLTTSTQQQRLYSHLYNRQETEISLRSHSSQSNIRSKKRVIKMLFVIVIEFFVCWTPLYLIYIWILIDRYSLLKVVKAPRVLMSMLRLLAYVSSCCNPITYCFMSKKFRAAFLTAFRCSKDPKPLKRRPTLQSTQVSYCDSQQSSKAKLLLSVSNGYHGNGKHLPAVAESPSNYV